MPFLMSVRFAEGGMCKAKLIKKFIKQKRFIKASEGDGLGSRCTSLDCEEMQGF